MTKHVRKGRERDERHALIIQSARELAEAEGWDAVTTRRLSQRIEYSQPVLYTHFRGKDEIVAAVALVGFGELVDRMKATITPKGATRKSLAALVATYVEYAEANPAVYDAMFALSTGLPFAQDETPKPMRTAFAVLREAVMPQNGEGDPDVYAEICWASLHGLVSLERSGRLPEHTHRQRMAALVDQFLAASAPTRPK
ncbi:TetR/AcrR family transcriptional regulator [Labedaea rhizosphaerae]|uniref:TetR family transcriptional regulator n=1 Tax=Labedaea rhizosphaerae TaxID=598644 RepID=A0A4R6SAQ3_LABRH|nr:TetR/AcrR family transcriptional regulator [Labedaea rhizosphaerae]TDP96634.1 TetR family transcriptional regulator [Labedaea rhizosphaerae]